MNWCPKCGTYVGPVGQDEDPDTDGLYTRYFCFACGEVLTLYQSNRSRMFNTLLTSNRGVHTHEPPVRSVESRKIPESSSPA